MLGDIFTLFTTLCVAGWKFKIDVQYQYTIDANMVFSYYTKFTNVDNCSYMSGILFLCRQLFLYVGYLVLMSIYSDDFMTLNQCR